MKTRNENSRTANRSDWLLFLAAGISLTVLCGCSAPVPQSISFQDELAFRDRCTDVIKRATRYKESGIVRAAGIEAMGRHLGAGAIEWMRASLNDNEAGVRFAALVALGAAGDTNARAWVLPCTNDVNPSVRLAACYALHRLGDTSRTGEVAQALLHSPSVDVRRNAAYLLALLGEKDATKLLTKAMADDDESVRRQALEAMTLLGDLDARQQLTFWASSGPGHLRVRAINVLAELKLPELASLFKYKLENGEYLEVRLAAVS